MNLSERAAYIRGLAEGLDLESEKKEVRVINEMLNLLSEMATVIGENETDLDILYDAVEQIDEDLEFLEDEVYGTGDSIFGEDIYEITCPNCGDIVRLDEEMLLSNDVECPGCGEKIEIELDACDCDCCSGDDD